MPQYQRKTNYTDRKLQGNLLVALVAMETLLLGAAILYLYLRFNAVVEDNLFKIHKADSAVLVESMFHELYRVIAYLLLANVAALVVAHFIWGKVVSRILMAFRDRLSLLANLDFSAPTAPPEIHHEVLDFTERWRLLEHQRCLKIRKLCRDLDEMKQGSAQELQKLKQQLAQLKSLI